MNGNLERRVKLCIKDIVENKIEHIPAEELLVPVWDCMVELYTNVNESSIGLVFTDKKETWQLVEEDMKTVRDKIDKLEVPYQMMAALYSKNIRETYTYYGGYDKNKAGEYRKIAGLLEMFGFGLTEEETQLLDGTHELYKQAEELFNK